MKYDPDVALISKTGAQRLQKAIEFMRTIPSRAHFDMSTWAEHDGKHGGGFEEHGIKPGQKLKPEDLHTCGTKACAAGWLATSLAWRRAGIALEARATGGYVRADLNDFRAIRSYLEVDESQFAALFINLQGVAKTPKQWAREAEYLLKAWLRGE